MEFINTASYVFLGFLLGLLAYTFFDFKKNIDVFNKYLEFIVLCLKEQRKNGKNCRTDLDAIFDCVLAKNKGNREGDDKNDDQLS